MDPLYTWTRIGKHDATESPSLAWYLDRQTKPHILDICGALIQEPAEFKGNVDRWITDQTTLCITGELKRSQEGDSASNYRYKKDSALNQNVIDNYLYLFTLHQGMTSRKPVFVTTIPRSWRLYSWLIQEDGSIIRKDEGYRKDLKSLVAEPGQVVETDTDFYDIEDRELLSFLDLYGVTPTALIKIRESCKGARYHTYLIDMISFLYQMKISGPEFHSTFAPDYRRVVSSDDDGEKPSKLSFEDTVEDGTVFFVPKKEDIAQLYHELALAISPEENTMKARIREHLVSHRIDRWTDFDANDTDDSFLFLMLIHAFKGEMCDYFAETVTGTYNDIAMTSEEGEILDSLEQIMEPWFAQLE